MFVENFILSIAINVKEQGPRTIFVRLLCSHLSRRYQKLIQPVTGNLARPAASFSDQLPVLVLGGSEMC
jgi:hypothetical protein